MNEKAISLNHEGVTLSRAGKWDEAVTAFNSALHACEDKLLRAEILRNRGDVLRRFNNPIYLGKARADLEESLHLVAFAETPSLVAYAATYQYLARYYRQIGDGAQALDNIRKAYLATPLYNHTKRGHQPPVKDELYIALDFVSIHLLFSDKDQSGKKRLHLHRLALRALQLAYQMGEKSHRQRAWILLLASYGVPLRQEWLKRAHYGKLRSTASPV